MIAEQEIHEYLYDEAEGTVNFLLSDGATEIQFTSLSPMLLGTAIADMKRVYGSTPNDVQGSLALIQAYCTKWGDRASVDIPFLDAYFSKRGRSVTKDWKIITKALDFFRGELEDLAGQNLAELRG